MSLKLTILGSSDKAGIPRIGCNCKVCQEARTFGESPLSRTRPCALIESKEICLLIDVTPDFRFQVMKLKRKIDVLYITHIHWDHVGGLIDLHYMEYTPKIITSSSNVTNLAKALGNSEAGSIPKVEIISPLKKTSLADIDVTPVRLNHSVETCGLLIEKDGAKIAYLLDSTSRIYPETIKICLDADFAVVDATTFDTKINNHMHALEAIDFAKKIRTRATILSHIGHHSLGHHALIKALNTYADVIPAFDGLVREV